MTRTPDEIKKGLEDAHKSCYLAIELGDPLGYPTAVYASYEATGNALDLIQQLQDENAQQARCIENMTDKLNAMNDEVAKLQAERDAAVKDIRKLGDIGANICPICVNCNGREVLRNCSTCGYDVKNGNFEWRGVTKEDGNAQ